MGYIHDDKDFGRGARDGDDVPSGYVAGLQEDLTELGFDTEGVDGDFGRNTETALKAFQKAAQGTARRTAEGIEQVAVTFGGQVDGRCDQPTRTELLLWQEHGYHRPPITPPVWDPPGPPKLVEGVPFAEPTGTWWPVRTPHKRGRTVAYRAEDGTRHDPWLRRFLAPRSQGKRYHVGVDLFGNEGDVVIACEPGTIVNWYHFYRGVFALIVQCDSGLVINYGEVARTSLRDFGLKKGDHVEAGQPIASVGKMRHSSMLHFETYAEDTTNNKRWFEQDARPSELRNPTAYLLELATSGQ